jgi:hypothetical protein
METMIKVYFERIAKRKALMAIALNAGDTFNAERHARSIRRYGEIIMIREGRYSL